MYIIQVWKKLLTVDSSYFNDFDLFEEFHFELCSTTFSVSLNVILLKYIFLE